MGSSEEKMTGALSFRVPTSFRLSIDLLAQSTGWQVTDIARLGLIVFWPEISAMVMTTRPNMRTEDFTASRDLARIVHQAEKNGINIREVLARALAENIANEVHAADANGNGQDQP